MRFETPQAKFEKNLQLFFRPPTLLRVGRRRASGVRFANKITPRRVANVAAWRASVGGRRSVAVVFWFVVFQILGVLLFSSVFMVIGASVNQLKEAQSLLIPVWLVLMIPLMVWFNVIRDPNGILATGLSFFPPSAPLMCILRLGTGAAIPAWHLPLSALLLMLTTAAILLLASRIYRASLLRSDGATTIMQILRRAA